MINRDCLRRTVGEYKLPILFAGRYCNQTLELYSINEILKQILAVAYRNNVLWKGFF
ncbi:unnamed protein product, partial [Linum tenue]